MKSLARPLRGLASRFSGKFQAFLNSKANFLFGIERSKWFCYHTVGENIKRVRNKIGLTQDDLVRKSGVKHTTLTKIESDVVIKLSVQTVAKIAKALGVPMEDMEDLVK